MATDDRLYDLQEADDHRFLVYSSANSYITPYSTDTHGGELITEFNQRAALNTLLKREVDLSGYADIVAEAVNNAFGVPVETDQTTGATSMQGPGLRSFKNPLVHNKANWHVTAYATGCRDEDDYKLSIAQDDGRLAISSGVALVYGYYVDAHDETKIYKADAISVPEIADVATNPGQNPENPCYTKFIKLAVQYTAPSAARHDERLIPPLNGVYQGAAIVINDELPYGNELLLGTITCDSQGHYLLTENPYKTRIIPLDGVQGAENYKDLLSAVDDDHIYGIKFGETGGSSDGEVTNLIDIDKWLWIAFESNLGMLLRSMSTNAETAGNAQDEPTRGIIVSDEAPYTGDDPVVDNFNCLRRIDAKTLAAFARMSWHQAQVPGKTGADVIDHRALYLPYASLNAGVTDLSPSYNSPSSDPTIKKPIYDSQVSFPVLANLHGVDGILTTQQLTMLELVFSDYANRRSSGHARGRQFGPFLTLDDAKNWFEAHTPTVAVGDYFWVINDIAEAGGTERANGNTVENIVTKYGTVSGTVTGTAKQSKLEANVTGSVTGNVTVNNREYPVEGSVNGTAQGTINATVTGTVTGTLDSFTQNVSARYVCRYASSAGADGWWRFAHAISMDEAAYNGAFTTTHYIGKSIIPGSLLITPESGYPISCKYNNIPRNVSTAIYDEGIERNTVGLGLIGKLWTRLTPNSNPIQVGTVAYESGAIADVDIRGDSHKGNIKFAYIDADAYTILDPGDSRSFRQDQNSPGLYQSVLFAVEAVERGFAVPATPNCYGVVKVGTGSELTDVINDQNTQRLRITDTLLGFIKHGGFKEMPDTLIPILPGVDLTQYQYCYYPNGVTFQMTGNASEWRAALDSTGTLAHIRGDVTLDFSAVIEDGIRSDGLLLHLEDIDYLTLKGDNLQVDTPTGHKSTETCLFGVNHCQVNKPFFTNIGEWKYSSFVSGGNTIELDLPWMMIPQIFTKAINSDDEDKGNSLSCRFSSITMGENGVCSAMLDVWVKYQGWEDYNGGIDRVWSSLGYVNFPPLFFEYNLEQEAEEVTVNEGETAPEVESRGPINQNTIIRIPDNLNLKISGTAGVHQGWDDNNSDFVPNGNLLVNMNWEWNGNPSSAKTRAGKVYLNLYMKNPSVDIKKQNFSNLRFRAPVQIIRLDNNSMSETVPYEQLYGSVDKSLN
jgi:hypothetical protein